MPPDRENPATLRILALRLVLALARNADDDTALVSAEMAERDHLHVAAALAHLAKDFAFLAADKTKASTVALIEACMTTTLDGIEELHDAS